MVLKLSKSYKDFSKRQGFNSKTDGKISTGRMCQIMVLKYGSFRLDSLLNCSVLSCYPWSTLQQRFE